LRYYEHRLPIAPGTGDGAPAAIADRQHYELVNFRRADIDQNYRRFFAVVTLAGLRVEDPAVFDATHEQIARWMRHDGIDGLRVDHPDGLADPDGYLHRLRELAGPDAWLTVEKILEPGEELPPEWPVDGTTGYDALAEVTGVFVDPDAEHELNALYRTLTDDSMSFADHVERGKRSAATTILRAEINRLARLMPDVGRANEALTELVIRFPVYRSYLPTGVQYLADTIAAVGSARPDLAETLAALAPRLNDPHDELSSRFQQVTGAVMAKGVEDTAYYRYTRFIALNEVGGDPATFGTEPEQFHAQQATRQAALPRSMTTLSTHDTKRGEDVRARLAVLAELPADWATLSRALMAEAPVPDPCFGYLLWQTFAGAGFIEPERMHAYAEKAMREAARATNWIDPDSAFEAAVHDVIGRAYADPVVHEPLAAFIERITPYGWSNSLGQKLVQLTMPGIPDIYQGSELWEDSLVDPDNRRPVDWDARRTLLGRFDSVPPPVTDDGAAKLWVVSRTLRLRRDQPDAFTSYHAMRAQGAAAQHAVAFDRGGVITVVTRLPVRLEREGGWRETTLDVAGSVTDVLSGRGFTGKIALDELLESYPVALLAR
jgi:(1->4)-alpha-D-glucan 1-alpha-D-glucosylmutase